MRDMRYERKADKRYSRKFSEKSKCQIVEVYDNSKPTSEILKEYDLNSSTFCC